MRSLFAYAFAFVAVGCGGAETAPPATVSNAGADAGAAGKAPSTMTPPANVTLPPERPMPRTELGSKIAKVRGKSNDTIGDPADPACVASAGATASLSALTKACVPSGKPAAPASVNVSDAQAAALLPLAADANGCYRVLAVAEAGVESFVVVVLDSKGMVAVERKSSGKVSVAPAEGPLCFSAADAAKVSISAGRGAGRVAVQVVRE